MLADLHAELNRGELLHADEKYREALKVFERVIDAAAQDGAAEADRLAAFAWRGKCQVLARERRWAEALDACGVFMARYGDWSEYEVRLAAGRVRRVLVQAASSLSIDASGRPGELALSELDSAIGWLGSQPEPSFLPALADRWMLKVRWHVRDSEGLDAADELVAVLAKLDDPALVRQIADQLLVETPWLFAVAEHDERATEALEESGELPFEPEESLLDDRHRMVRLARSFNELAELLDRQPQRRDQAAKELRAGALLHVAIALARLGQIDASEQVLEQVAALDQAAIAACDRMGTDALRRGAELDSDGGPNLIAAAILKARIHAANRRKATALSALEGVLARFQDSDQPWIIASLEAAVELRDELLADAGPEPTPPSDATSPTTSSTGTGRVVWRRQ